jgi:hypothetical protein
MPEFDRDAAILTELASLDDDATAQTAQITFRTQEDYGTCRVLRESIAEEYRNGRADDRNRWRTAEEIGADVAGRGDQMLRFAAMSDIGDLTVTYEHSGIPGTNEVPVNEGDDLDDVVSHALTVRLTHAAYQLLTYLEDVADDKEDDHVDTDTDDD